MSHAQGTVGADAGSGGPWEGVSEGSVSEPKDGK